MKVRLPLANSLSSRVHSSEKDGRIKNAYVKKTEGGNLIVKKRPAIDSVISSTYTGVGQGIHYIEPESHWGRYSLEDSFLGAGSSNGTITALHRRFIVDDSTYAASNVYDYIVVVASGGDLYKSTDLVNWSNVYTGSITINAIWSEGNLTANDTWVAVGNDGTILYSTDDGGSWAAATSGTSEHLYCVTKADTLWVVAGANGQLRTASDPASTWTSRTSGVATTIRGIAANEIGNTTVDVAFCTSGGAVGVSGDDGATWTAETAGAVDLYAIVYDVPRSGFIAVGDTGVIRERLSSTALGSGTWNLRTSGTTSNLRHISYMGRGAEAASSGELDTDDSIVMGGTNVVLYQSAASTWSPYSSIATGTHIPILLGTKFEGIVFVFNNVGNRCIAGVGPSLDWSDSTSTRTLTFNNEVTPGDNVYAVSGLVYKGTTRKYALDLSLGSTISGVDENRVYFTPHKIGVKEWYAILQPSTTLTAPSTDYNGQLFVALNSGFPIVTSINQVKTSILTYKSTTGRDPLAHGVVSMDGYLFVLTTSGKIYNSISTDPRKWPSTNYIEAEIEPDQGRFVAKHNNHIVAFGTRSIEFFYNAGNPTGSPLRRRDDIRYDIGCHLPNSVAQAGDTIFFVGGTSSGQSRAAYVLSDFKLAKISTPAVEAILENKYNSYTNNYSGQKSGLGSILTVDGEGFYVLNLMDSSQNPVTLVYNSNTQTWSQWYVQDRTGDGTWIVNSTVDVFDIIGISKGTSNQLLAQLSTGEIVSISASSFQDWSTNPIEVIVQTPKIDLTTMGRKYLNMLTVVPYDTPTSSSTLTIQWSDDDYANFNTARTVDLNSNTWPKLSRCGQFRRRAFKLTHTANTDLMLEALELDITGDVPKKVKDESSTS